MSHVRFALFVFSLMVGFSLVGGVAAKKVFETVYVHVVHNSDDKVSVGDTFANPNRAIRAAEKLETEDLNTWVMVEPSRFFDKKNKDKSIFAVLGIIGEVLAQVVVLDGEVNTAVILTEARRSGEFHSPDVQFTSQFETLDFDTFLPTDEDLLDGRNSIEIEMTYAPDISGPWTKLCGAGHTFGRGRESGKDGQPILGVHTGCSGRTDGQLRSVETLYHMKITVGGEMAVSGRIAVPTR